jgi:hypothetical protein
MPQEKCSSMPQEKLTIAPRRHDSTLRGGKEQNGSLSIGILYSPVEMTFGLHPMSIRSWTPSSNIPSMLPCTAVHSCRRPYHSFNEVLGQSIPQELLGGYSGLYSQPHDVLVLP